MTVVEVEHLDDKDRDVAQDVGGADGADHDGQAVVPRRDLIIVVIAVMEEDKWQI